MAFSLWPRLPLQQEGWNRPWVSGDLSTWWLFRFGQDKWLFLLAQDCRGGKRNPRALHLFSDLFTRFLFIDLFNDRRGRRRTGTGLNRFNDRVTECFFLYGFGRRGIRVAGAGLNRCRVARMDAVVDPLSQIG